MINTEHTSITNLIIHDVGNKLLEEELNISDNEITLNDNTYNSLLTYFLKPFKDEALFHLKHDNEPSENQMFNFASQIFSDRHSFVDTSKKIAKHLFDKGVHQKISRGYFHVVFFEEIVLADELTDAIGLFKSERTEDFLQIIPNQQDITITTQQGFPLNKLEKGAIIFNTEQEKGYKVALLDKTPVKEAEGYWKNDFLNLANRKDNYYHTENYMKLCKDFVKDVFNEDNQVEKAEQIELLNKSVAYFQEKDNFNVKEFEEEVIQYPEVVEAFREYKEHQEEENDLKTYDEFDISKNAVKNTKRQMKSVLKLDKNFSVYIHANKREYINKGYDAENDMHFYQLFFKEEK